MASSASFVGVPPGNTSMYQPPPKIHGASGLAAAYSAITRSYASRT